MAKPTRSGSGNDSASSKNDNFNAQAGAAKLSASISNDNGSAGPSIFKQKMKARATERQDVSLTLTQYCEAMKTDKTLYARPSENLISAFGEPITINTKLLDEKEDRYHGGETIQRYEPFKDFFGVEKVISRTHKFLQSGAKGMLVYNGPVGSGKTEITETLEELVEQRPIAVLKCKSTGAISPFMDSPLCILADPSLRDYAIKELGVHESYFKGMIQSPWVSKRLKAHDNDPEEAFEVVLVYPSRDSQMGIGKYDPLNKDNPDFSALIGRVDMDKVGEPDPLYESLYKMHREKAIEKKALLEQEVDPDIKAEIEAEIAQHEKKAQKFRGKTLSEGDPDAYISGLLSKSNGGLLHLAEFLRNNPAMMNVFLEGVTTGYFTGAANVGRLPMRQVIVMTSNGPVLDEFRAAKESDAARNRITEIKVPYTLRMDYELDIYKKLLKANNLETKEMAPKTLDLLAEFSIAARLKDGTGTPAALKAYDHFTRVKVWNGEKPDGVKVPDIRELRSKASEDEGLSGFSVRDAERTMTLAFSMRSAQGIEEADTITMLEAIRMRLHEIDVNDISADEKKRLSSMINTLEERNKKELEKIVNAAIMSADEGTCQRIFDEYVYYARAWIAGSPIRSPIGEPIDMTRITKHLEVFEKRANITNGPDFRKTTVAYIAVEEARIGKANYGKKPEDQRPVALRWDEYEPVAKSIRDQFEVDRESRMHILRAKTEADLRSNDEKKQFNVFHQNMRSKGYTDSMVERMLHHLSYA